MDEEICVDSVAKITLAQKNVGPTIIIKGAEHDFIDFHCLQNLNEEKRKSVKAIAIIALYTHTLKADIFKEFPNLKEILITDSNISALAEDLLADIKYLEKFWIIKSNLTIVPVDLFRNNYALQSINLSQNKLQELPDSLLRNNHRVQYFYAFSNKLTRLSPEFFINQQELVDVSLAENFKISPDEIREKYKDEIMANEKRIIAMQEQLNQQPKYFASFAGESGIARLRELLAEQ